MKCLKPTPAWQCGYKCAKDGVLSPYLTFSPREALSYFMRSASSVVRSRRLRKLKHHFVDLFDRSPDCNLELTAFDMMSAHEVSVPCGKCLACQIRKRKDMSVRLAHEVSLVEDCCFITLTYDEAHVPMVDGNVIDFGKDKSGSQTLLPRDVQLFMKRIRHFLSWIPKKHVIEFDHLDKPIRYFCCGEYGSKTKRPHYHILIFGWKPSDMTVWSKTGNRYNYRSAMVERCWKNGHVVVQDVGAGVAKYCAKYVTKKLTRTAPLADGVCSEFFLQSTRNGGIGSLWLDKFKETLLRGFVTVRNGERVSKCSIPRYYIRRLRKLSIPLYLKIRDERIDFIKSHHDDKSCAFEDTLRECQCFLEQVKHENEKEII